MVVFGEPTIPGISIGHNESGAWADHFAIDGEDLMVYKINPANSNQYWYNGARENMQSEQDTIRLRVQNRFSSRTGLPATWASDVGG